MLQVVVPVFLVILVGYGFGRKHQFAAEAEKLINEYVLYIALPALLFLAVARANPADLAQWPFMAATLAGIAAAYLAGLFLARAKGTSAPQSSIVGMAACYGTTGYMGIPILIAAFGPKAAVPAAIATILHNIPAIMAVIITHDLTGQKQSSPLASAGRALATTLKNPLTMAVLAGAFFCLLRIPLPTMLTSFTGFLAAAAGPTALFALGLGLARIPFSAARLSAMAGWIAPVVLIKILIQPLVTLGMIAIAFKADIDIWYATAVVMAAQPIGAGAYVFGRKYGYFSEETSLAIIVSLLITVLTLTLVLQTFAASIPA
ncbi:AEC family transporter [Agrobacterium vitis]|uniref:AEC family transporter n=1 Tax=Agrobacterium vitis TaxID=373 RepID=UPI0012E72549|nr:AEC family transporter [Agrobacterium vitis]MVA27322.1 AEC family transporter [Agrobacterium vitis]